LGSEGDVFTVEFTARVIPGLGLDGGHDKASLGWGNAAGSGGARWRRRVVPESSTRQGRAGERPSFAPDSYIVMCSSAMPGASRSPVNGTIIGTCLR
jgi:hypothetical protein